MFAFLRRLICFLGGCVTIVGLDLFCKHYFFDQVHSFSLLGGWVQSVQHYNHGIAFNIPVPQWLILLITFVACLGIIILFFRTRRTTSPWFALLLGILLGGAFGNGFDRWSLGFVRDWLLLWHRSAINIADLGVLFGLVGAVVLYQKRSVDTDSSVEDHPL